MKSGYSGGIYQYLIIDLRQWRKVVGVIVIFIVKYEIVGEDSECNNEKNLLFIVT